MGGGGGIGQGGRRVETRQSALEKEVHVQSCAPASQRALFHTHRTILKNLVKIPGWRS